MIRLFFGPVRPRKTILGTEFAGEIEAVGRDVERFKEGDQVFAATGIRFGAYAEYMCLSEEGAPAILLQVVWTSKVGSKKAKIAATGMRPPREKTRDLVFLKDLVEAGEIKPVLDRSYPLEQAADAHRYVETGHKRGGVIVTMERDSE